MYVALWLSRFDGIVVVVEVKRSLFPFGAGAALLAVYRGMCMCIACLYPVACLREKACTASNTPSLLSSLLVSPVKESFAK